jgi:tRNA uridine 5-carbamoylmethylation protein Kti12
MNTPHVTVITGPPRTGKSIYAEALRKRLYDEGHRVLVINDFDDHVDLFKHECGSAKWDHIIVTTNKPWYAQEEPRRIHTIVRTSQV